MCSSDLCGELIALGLPLVVALNMMDMAKSRGLAIDIKRLSALIGCPVIPVVARRGVGMDAVREAIERVTQITRITPPELSTPNPTLEVLTAWADRVTAATVTGGTEVTAEDAFTEKLDRYLTHPLYGMAAFVAVMCGLFWVLFVLASVPMDLIEALFGGLASTIAGVLPPGPVQDLLTGGIIGGLSGTIVFLPQIALLFFLISLLEDTG